MNIYIQSLDGKLPFNDSMYKAWYGFREMGFDPIFFTSLSELDRANLEDIIVGDVDMVQGHLSRFDIVCPELDYPSELEAYLGRSVWKTTAEEIAGNPSCWPVFLKPVSNKQFTGRVVKGPADLMGLGARFGESIPAFASDAVSFVSEYRVFVRYGKVLGVSHYRGRFDIPYSWSVIESAIGDFASAPAAYALDFGVTADGKTLLVEVNDGYALGSYGLNYELYTMFLMARWAELTGTEDICDSRLERFDWKQSQQDIF